MSFFSNLVNEIRTNGKTAVGVLLSQIPGLTSFPGISTAIHTALNDHTPASYIDVAVQLLMVVGASIKASKIVKTAVLKT